MFSIPPNLQQPGDQQSSLRLDPEDYTVGWICAITVELIAARALLDKTHLRLKVQPKYDENTYILGSIGDHNVVIAGLSEYGTTRSAVAAKSMQSTFPNLRFGLMVGVGGGVPSADNDIRLGDLVISLPTGTSSGVIQYDLGRAESEFRRVGSLNKPPNLLRTALGDLRATRNLRQELSRIVNEAFKETYEEEEEEEWTYPKAAVDILFHPEFPHIGHQSDCAMCSSSAQEGNIVVRAARRSTNPLIHYGNIGSGNRVMKNAIERDCLARMDNVICFEMEAAGLMDDFPCLIIRGISDYSDSHKNWKWQPYAAAIAAAYAKRLLLVIASEAIRSLDPIQSSSQSINIGSVSFMTPSVTQTVIHNYDFSVVKTQAPHEFYGLGQVLAPGRRELAEDGILHVTARRLGAIFESILPHTPALIKCYGLRASEIAMASSNEPSTRFGIFSGAAGFDGASLWAGATSGEGAIQVHLLACLLARMWTAPEATSIWFELLKCRRDELQSDFDKTGSMPIGTMIAIQHQLDRSQLAEWDASARAWLQIADGCKSLQQRKVMHAIGSFSNLVNSKPVLYESVINAWMAGLKGMNALLQGSPMEMKGGNMLPALCAWHLYPDLNILNSDAKIVSQKDLLVPESAILTIGLQTSIGSQEDEGLRWSLPLAHLRFYGDPVRRTHTLNASGSRLSLVEFNMAILGCVLGGWDVADRNIEIVVRWIGKLSKSLRNLHSVEGILIAESWLHILGSSADTYLTSKDLDRRHFTQILNSGRKHPSFLGRPDQPFFGLCDMNRVISLANSMETKIKILRAHVALARMDCKHAIIRYISPDTGREEFATAVAHQRDVPKRTRAEATKTNTGHIRWIHQQPVQNPADTDSHHANTILQRKDVFLTTSKQYESELYSQIGLLIPGQKRTDEDSLSPSQHDRLIVDPIAHKMEASVQYKATFAVQKERYEGLGEEVRSIEDQTVKTILCPGREMRVVWDEDKDSLFKVRDEAYQAHQAYQAYEPQWGDMKHYELWLGDPDDVAIFIRMDLEEPEVEPSVPFIELYGLFSQDALQLRLLPVVLVDSIANEDLHSYYKSLEAFSAMNLLYNKLQHATIDVRVLERTLATTAWSASLNNPTISEDMFNSSHKYSVEDDSDCDNEDSGKKQLELIPDTHFVEDAGFSLHVPGASTSRLHSLPSQVEFSEKDYDLVIGLLKVQVLSIQESFSCILFFENCFDISASQLNRVIAISSDNSLFIAAPLLSDPARSIRRVKIRHVMGNVGRPGIALLRPPIEPRTASCGIERWPSIIHAPWDSFPRDSFRDSSLHLWFTGSTQEIDVGHSGAQDKELYYLESVVSLHGKGEWIADLDVLTALQESSLVTRYGESGKTLSADDPKTSSSKVTCEHISDDRKYRYDELPLAATETWWELLDLAKPSSIFLASQNWQARLAAMMICVAQKRRICLLPRSVCWRCLSSAQNSRAQVGSSLIFL